MKGVPVTNYTLFTLLVFSPHYPISGCKTHQLWTDQRNLMKLAGFLGDGGGWGVKRTLVSAWGKQSVVEMK